MNWISKEIKKATEKFDKEFERTISRLSDYVVEHRDMARRMVRGYDRQLNKRIIRDVAPLIIRQYHSNAEDIVRSFLQDTMPHSTNEKYPTLHSFMEWYCDSRIIQIEVDNERRSSKMGL